jgi:hypothetical protein
MQEPRADRARSRPEPDVAEPDTEEGEARGGLGAAAATALALQTTAGNAAVARLLGRAPERNISRLLTGNPADLTDPTTGSSTTTNATPGIQDALTTGGYVPTPPGTTTAEHLDHPGFVKPAATEAAPWVGSAPAQADLFERSEQAAPGFTSVSSFQGMRSAPMVDQIADSSLWIDPGPKPLDVQQMGIGDCYALSTIISIVNRDPGKITGMMAGDGRGGASVTLYHRQQAPPGLFGIQQAPTYVAEQVAVTGELAFDRTSPGATSVTLRDPAHPEYGHQIHGAQLIAGDTPRTMHWWVVVNGGTLEVHRRDIFQTARWAPLLEKAIERFSQSYGQYGHGAQIASEGENTGSSGQVNIDGGWSGSTLSLFYGQEGEVIAGGRGDEQGTSWGPGQSAATLLGANQAAFDGLLTLAGRGAHHEAGDTSAPIVTATTGVGDPGRQMYATRLQAAIAAAIGDADWQNLTPAAQVKVTTANTAIPTWQLAAPDANPAPQVPQAGTKTWAFNLMQTACTTAASDAELQRDERTGPMKAMLDLLLVIQNMGSDHGGGTRSVYADHVYSVLSVDIKQIGGGDSPIAMMPAMFRRALYPTIDLQASSVMLMNPHHTNAPDATGTQSSDAAGADPATGLTSSQTGQFTLSLDRFFMLYGSVMSNELTIPAY